MPSNRDGYGSQPSLLAAPGTTTSRPHRGRPGLSLLCLSNFLASFGGGLVLAASMGLLEREFLLWGEAPLAMLTGWTISLGLMGLVPVRWRSRGVWALSWTAAGIGGLIWLVLDYRGPGEPVGAWAWLVFALLSLHVGFWMTTRGLRSDASAGYEQQLSWVELSYYVGAALGLYAESWELHHGVSGTKQVLVMDIVLFLVAGAFDVLLAEPAPRVGVVGPEGTPEPAPRVGAVGPEGTPEPAPRVGAVGPEGTPEPAAVLLNRWTFARLAASMAILTAGIESVFFGAVHEIHLKGPDGFASEVWALSYLGSIAAAIVCAVFRTRVEWPGDVSPRDAGGYRGGSVWRARYTTAIVFIGVTSLAIVLPPSGTRWGQVAIILGSVVMFVAAEILYLAVADRIGLEGRQEGHTGRVAFLLGFMGLSAALATLLVIHVAPAQWFVLMSSLILAIAIMVPKAVVLAAPRREADGSGLAPDPLTTTTP